MLKKSIKKFKESISKQKEQNNKKNIENLVVFLILLIITIIAINTIWGGKKEVYKKYNEKGLTIIGISLDRVKDSWSEAIRKNNLNVWPQILSSETNEKDEKENNLSYLYNCDAIPFYVLIDKEGKVVAKWEHIGDVQLKELDMLIK